MTNFDAEPVGSDDASAEADFIGAGLQPSEEHDEVSESQPEPSQSARVKPSPLKPRLKQRERVQRRNRKGEDEFTKAAETGSSPNLSVEHRVKRRADGRYYGIINFRGTEKQKALIDYAAGQAGLSRQKLIEGILMPELEKLYGSNFDKSETV